MLTGYGSFGLFPHLTVILLLLTLWELAWKGLGLWKAAKNSHKLWFVSILIFNTLGILPIVYYFFFSGRQQQLAHHQATVTSPRRQAARKARKKR